MRFKIGHLGFVAIALASVALTGCNNKSGGDSKQPAAAKHHDGDAHDHAAGEHSEVGPHGGHLIELGKEEYHAELIDDDQTHQVTIHILDGAAKQSVPIAQPEVVINITADGRPKQFKLAAMPLGGGGGDMASAFQTQSEELCEALDSANAKARLTVTINGKQFVGEIEHHEHEGHDHEHDRKK